MQEPNKKASANATQPLYLLPLAASSTTLGQVVPWTAHANLFQASSEWLGSFFEFCMGGFPVPAHMRVISPRLFEKSD